ncbi:hypothetical protein OSTOST_05223 [Ostertagia ostertagi]
MYKSFYSPLSSRDGRTTRNIELSTREALALAALCGFAAFILHNADMKTVIHVFTLVPAIMFTLRILAINNDNSTISVTTVAMFWMYYGMGLICDALIGADDSYAIVQLVLVGALGVTAYRGHPTARVTDSEDFRTIHTDSYTLIQQTQSPKVLSHNKGTIKSTSPLPQSLPTAADFSSADRVPATQSSTSALFLVTAKDCSTETLAMG